MSNNSFREQADKIRLRRKNKPRLPSLTIQKIKKSTGDFICPRHWAQVETANADPFTVILGCGTYLYHMGYTEPVRHACCILEKAERLEQVDNPSAPDAFTGVVQRAKIPDVETPPKTA